MPQTRSEQIDRTTPAFARDGFAQRVQATIGAVNAVAVAAVIGGVTAKLDTDSGVTDTNYAATIVPIHSGAVLAAFNALLVKLDADAGVTDTNFVQLLKANSNAELGDKFNALLLKLDRDATVNLTTYVSGHTAAVVTSID